MFKTIYLPITDKSSGIRYMVNTNQIAALRAKADEETEVELSSGTVILVKASLERTFELIAHGTKNATEPA